MRHRPPWTVREWVTTAEGRASQLGSVIDCPLCDRIAMPEAAREYKRTASFDEKTLPSALGTAHRTKPGTWGRIVVEAGEVEYHVRGRVHVLAPGAPGLIEPERLHRLAVRGPFLLHVEFWRED